MTPEEKPFDTSRIPVFYQNGSVKVGDKEYAPGEYPLGTDTPTNKITADAVERTADWLQDHIGERYKGAATMLRDLWRELEEVRQDRDDMTTAARSLNADVTDLGKKLAAANERAIDYRNKWIALGGVMVDALNAETD